MRLPRLSPTSALVTLLLAGAAGVAGYHLPGDFRRAEARVDAVAGLSRAERELLPARSFDLATELFVAARERIPPEASYAVQTGARAGASNPLVLEKVPPFADYYLLPRRRVADARSADWLVSYGGDPTAAGLDYAERIEVLPGFELARVAR